MSSSPDQQNPINDRFSRAPVGNEPPAALLAYGVLEELYRRRSAIGFAAVMTLFLLAAAVGLQVWTVDVAAGAALDNPGLTVSDSSTDAATNGPSGTWQRWGDLGSQKLSQSPAAVLEGSSTTTFSSSAETTTTTTIPSITVTTNPTGS